MIYKRFLAVEKWDESITGVLNQITRFSFLWCNKLLAFCRAKVQAFSSR